MIAPRVWGAFSKSWISVQALIVQRGSKYAHSLLRKVAMFKGFVGYRHGSLYTVGMLKGLWGYLKRDAEQVTVQQIPAPSHDARV